MFVQTSQLVLVFYTDLIPTLKRTCPNCMQENIPTTKIDLQDLINKVTEITKNEKL